MSVARDAVRHDTRVSGLVRRYHTWPTLTQQSVGEHSWQVLRIYNEIFGAPAPEVTVAIIYHDSPELVTGDPPFPIKAENPDLADIYRRLDRQVQLAMLGYETPELDEATRRRVKICDLLDMWEFGLHEELLGNIYAGMVVQDTLIAARFLFEFCTEDEKTRITDYTMKRLERTGTIRHG